jgi:hypothetical protein
MVDLSVTKLTVVKKADLVGKDEPMLWTMFIVLSLETISSLQFVVTTDPVAGKLGKAGKGDSLNIPASVGRFHSDASGIGFVGLAGIAFDNDLRSVSQIRSGYAAGAAALNQAIRDHFPKHGFAPMEAAERAEIADKVREAVKTAFLADSVFLTVFGGKPLGGAAYTRTLSEDSIDETFKLEMHAKRDVAIYRVNGRLQFQR